MCVCVCVSVTSLSYPNSMYYHCSSKLKMLPYSHIAIITVFVNNKEGSLIGVYVSFGS